MPVLQVLEALAQRLELRVPGVLAEAACQLDRDFLGLLFRVGVAEDCLQQLGIQNQRVEIIPHRIDMDLVDGPFRKLHGRWDFHALDESACKVTLTLEFEPSSRLLAPAMALGFQGLADRMVDDFVRAADRGE